MKHLPPYTLLLLIVLYHSFSDGRCEPLFVSIGENVTIKCKISNPDQDGVYLYIQQDKNKVETVLYYYKEDILTTEKPFHDRVTINRNFGDFFLSLSNVTAMDQGVYWCKFNKLDKYTESDRTFLFTLPKIKKVFCVSIIYLGVISGQSFLILILVVILAKLCCKCSQQTPKHQPSNGVYEDMRGNTTRALHNPAYESSERRMHL